MKSKTLSFEADYNSLVDWSIEAIISRNEGLEPLKRDKALYDCLLKGDLRQYYRNREADIQETINEYVRIWNDIESIFRATIEDLFGFDIKKDIKAFITFLPIFPRDLENRHFLVPFDGSESYRISIVLHEYLHFVFFDKLNNYSPSKVQWLVSELMIPLCFDYFSSKQLFDNLICSNYCLNKNSIFKGKGFFEEYKLHKISYETLVKKLELIVKEELL